MFLLTLYQFQNRKFCLNELQLKHRKLAPPFSPPLTVKPYLKLCFLYWGRYMTILHLNERSAKKEKTVVHPCVCSICCILKESYSNLLQNDMLLISWEKKRSIEIFKKKLFLISLFAHLILMNMLRLNNLIFQN